MSVKNVLGTLLTDICKDNISAFINCYITFFPKVFHSNTYTWLGDMGSIPESEDPLEKEMATAAVFFPGKSHGQKTTVHGVAKS